MGSTNAPCKNRRRDEVAFDFVDDAFLGVLELVLELVAAEEVEESRESIKMGDGRWEKDKIISFLGRCVLVFRRSSKPSCL